MAEQLSHILVPVDFSEHSQAAIAYATTLVQRMGGDIELFHVVDDPFISGAWRAEAFTPNIPELLDQLAADDRDGHRDDGSAGAGDSGARGVRGVRSDCHGHARPHRRLAPLYGKCGRARRPHRTVSCSHGAIDAGANRARTRGENGHGALTRAPDHRAWARCRDKALTARAYLLRREHTAIAPARSEAAHRGDYADCRPHFSMRYAPGRG